MSWEASGSSEPGSLRPAPVDDWRELSLDDLLGRLEGALHRLADPAAPLEQAVADYQQARALLAAAETGLEAARRRAAALDVARD